MHLLFQKNDYYLDHVKAAFSRLGFIIIQDEGEDWDVLWVHEYPFFTMSTLMHNLQPHQRVWYIYGIWHLFLYDKISMIQVQENVFIIKQVLKSLRTLSESGFIKPYIIWYWVWDSFYYIMMKYTNEKWLISTVFSITNKPHFRRPALFYF